MSTDNTPSVGIRAWGANSSRPRQYDDDLPRLPFMKLQPGINNVRIVSNIGTYFQARWKGPLSKRSYGDRIRTSYPTYGEDCPVKKYLGLTGKERHFVVVIDRADGELKILDLSQLTAEQVETNLEVKNSVRPKGQKVTPRDFDISIKFDPKSKTATGFYSVVAHDTLPMSEKDLGLIEDVGGEDILDKVIQRQIVSPKPETVEKRLKALGWVKPEAGAETGTASTETASSLEEPEEDDYSFQQPVEGEEAKAANE